MFRRGFHFLPIPFPRTYSLLLALVLLLGSPSGSGADVITVDASRIANTNHSGYAPSNPILLGQTFTAPAGVRSLTHFDFRMHLTALTDIPEMAIPFELRGYVARWDDASSAIAGAPLYTSTPLLLGKPFPASDAARLDPESFQLLSFNTGRLPVQADQTFIAFVTAFGLTDEVSRAGFAMGTIALSYCGYDFCAPDTGSNYPQGNFIFAEVSGPLPTDLAGMNNEVQLDTAFRVTFDSAAPIPEPSTLLLLSAAGLAGLTQRKRLRTNRN